MSAEDQAYMLKFIKGKVALKPVKKPEQNKQGETEIIKITVCGPSNVGKTSLVNGQQLKENVYQQTIGVDFRVHQMQINGKSVKFQCWDTSSGFINQTQQFYKVGSFVIFVYNANSKQSYNSMKNLFEQIMQKKLLKPQAKGLLIANKCDLGQEVSSEQSQEIAGQLGGYMQTSVKDDHKIIFQICENAYNRLHDSNSPTIQQLFGGQQAAPSAPVQYKPQYSKPQPSPSPSPNINQQDQSFKYLIKTVIMGHESVGKSSIMNRYTDNTFDQNYIATIGVDFKIKVIQVNQIPVKLQIWDTAGQQRFRSITKCYITQGKIILLVYNCNDRKTFEKLNDHIQSIQENLDKLQKFYCCIVANQSFEKQQTQEVSMEEGMSLAEKFGYQFMEVSAKQNININDMFINGADWLIKNEALEPWNNN